MAFGLTKQCFDPAIAAEGKRSSSIDVNTVARFFGAVMQTMTI